MKIEKIRVGVVGEYQSGKSLLINCLLKQPIATIGDGDSTTHAIVIYSYTEENERVELFDSKGKVVDTFEVEDFKRRGLQDTNFAIKKIDVYLNNQLLKDFVLVDMPGMGYSDEEDEIAEDAMKEIDYAILVERNTKAIGDRSFRYIDALEYHRIPYYFVLNCVERDWVVQGKKWHPTSPYNINLARRNKLQLTDCYKPMIFPFEEEDLLVVNLMWYWYSIQDEDDELLKKEEIQSAINLELRKYDKEIVEKISKFHLIEKIFSMENRMYLELKKEIKEEIQKLRNEVCPVGTIQAFAFERIPEGWMICDGRWLQVLDYPELFGAIGHTFGKVDDDSFRIPDLRGRFVRGWGKDSGIDKNRKFGSAQGDAIQKHIHSFDTTRLLISDGGKHYHPLWCDEYDTVYSVTGLAGTDKGKRMCYPTNSYSSGKTDLGPYAGEHNHSITALEHPIGAPATCEEDIRLASETRPTNVALLYCIKTGIHSEARFFSNLDGDIVENPYADIDDSI